MSQNNNRKELPYLSISNLAPVPGNGALKIGGLKFAKDSNQVIRIGIDIKTKQQQQKKARLSSKL